MLGHDDADTLMAHLPPVTWSEVATKGDLKALGTNLCNELRADFVEAMARILRLVGTGSVGQIGTYDRPARCR